MRDVTKQSEPDENRSKESLLQELEDLRQRERQLRAVIDNCPVPLFLKDTEGRYLLVNKEYQKWYHTSEADILGGSLELVLSPEQVEVARARDRKVLETRRSDDRELDLTFPDGVTRRSIGTKFPVIDDADDLIGLGGVRIDVTALRAAEAALEKAHGELEQRVKDRTRDLSVEVQNHKKTSEALRESETQLREITDSLPVLIAYLDVDMRYRMINKTGAQWYGKPVADVIGMSPEDIFGPQQEHWGEQMGVAFGGQETTYERRLTYPDGATRDVRAVYVPHTSSNGQVNGIFALIEDISEHKVAERALQTSEERFRNFFELPLIGSAIYTVPDKKWIAINDAFCEMLGYNQDEFSTLTWLDITHPDDRAENLALYEAAISDAGKDSYSMDKRFIRKDGEIVFATIVAHTVRDENGEPVYNLLSVRDTTQQKEAERSQRENDILLHSIIDNAPALVSLKDLDGRYLLVNEAFARSRQSTPEKLVGKTTHTQSRQEHATAVDAHQRMVIETGMAITEERDTFLPNGERHQGLVTKFPIFDENGNITRVGSFGADISKIKEAETNLRNSERRFRDFAEATSDSFWEMDANLHFSNNTLMQDSVHATADEIIGKTRWEVAGADALNDPHWSAHRQDMEAHLPFRNFEYWIDDKAGNARCISISGVPQFEDSGAFLGYRGGAMDVTNLKKAETAVRAALEDARESDKAKQDFLANMSHELRTPLNAIMGFSEVLQMEFFGPLNNARYLDYVNDISQSANHLLDLVNDILDLSKIEAGKLELSFTDIDLTAVAATAVRELTGQMRKKSQHFSMNIDQDAATIHADGAAIRQMLTNLLSNAMKFTPENGDITLSVGLTAQDFVRITVSDSGVGIPQSDIEKVLSPFGQSGDMEVAREGGTGLGLPIVTALVKLHKGTLEIESAVGVGTQVHITLPMIPETAASDHDC
jgi:PAS domain S-box-containing protein